jgi:hypothetical protein
MFVTLTEIVTGIPTSTEDGDIEKLVNSNSASFGPLEI